MGRPRSFDTDTALLAVQNQFRRTGYAGTSVDDIAAATGLGRGSLFAAFGDKHKLFMSGLAAYCQRNERALQTLLDVDDEAALERLHEFLLGAAQVGLGGSGEHCMATKFALELDGLDPEAEAMVSASFTAMEGLLAGAVRAAQRAGTVQPAADAALLGSLVFATSRGLAVMAGAGRTAEQLTTLAEAAFASLPAIPRATT